jgi:hypothetical protein
VSDGRVAVLPLPFVWRVPVIALALVTGLVLVTRLVLGLTFAVFVLVF